LIANGLQEEIPQGEGVWSHDRLLTNIREEHDLRERGDQPHPTQVMEAWSNGTMNIYVLVSPAGKTIAFMLAGGTPL
jgi:hypothetical protein